ncbi:tripartite tricarboxylate transporter permease [uncultured Desulfovibrio sp.]|uniref:tripartite tricarboxylate transporter permease n=2 Tax=uncultured Desulfovibrio sp. TaxID=167968 RepID=UPI0026709493|nr:tripartite tricarboxylate transporter permease [uncultured Desulfovibrio sp.]
MLDFIVQGFVSALVPENLLVMFIGLLVGIVGGMLPGITTVTAVALFVPFTFSMSPEMALIALGGVFCGAMYGGANAAILINTPGTPGSIATSLDGYPLTRQGRAEEACYVALLASTLGGIFGVVALMLFFEPLSKVALSFGSEAFFWMGLFGLSTLAAMFPGHIAKGLLGGAMGLALGTVGLDPVMGMPRFTFDVFSLVQGLDMVALMIGLFSVSQMFVMLESNETYIVSMARQAHALKRALIAVLRHLRLLGVASAIGTFIGALPGAGGSVAALVSYNEAKRWDKNPDRYGQGAIEGILVPESANNASVGGSLVPLLSLGIPGSAAAAVLAGGLMAQGLTPGPQLMEKNPDIAYAFIVSMILANIGMLFIGYLLVRICTRILDVPKLLIIPAVISISFLGAYALRNSMFDVMLMIVSGAIAYVLLKAHIMPAAIALGLVLGRIIEENLIVTCYRAQAKDSLADLLVFSPMAAVFMAACVLAVVIPLWLTHRKERAAGIVRRPRLSAACLGRYDFWVVLLITLGGIFFFNQSRELTGVSSYFPQAVYASIIGLGVFIMGMQAFQSAPKGRALPSCGALGNIGIYLGIMVMAYLLIEPLGFYTALFLGTGAMTAYGVFGLTKRKCDWRGFAFVLGYTLLLTIVEYGCFRLLMGVQTPTGFLL